MLLYAITYKRTEPVGPMLIAGSVARLVTGRGLKSFVSAQQRFCFDHSPQSKLHTHSG